MALTAVSIKINRSARPARALKAISAAEALGFAGVTADGSSVMGKLLP